MNEQILLLYEDCKVVTGYKRSAIYDLCRHEFKFIPNSLAQIIDQFKGKPVHELLSAFSEEDQQVIQEYLRFLVKNEYIHFCDPDEVELFPKLTEEFRSAGEISNSIIELSPITIAAFESIIDQLTAEGCCHLELRTDETYTIAEFSDVLANLRDAPIRSVSLVARYAPEFDITTLSSLIAGHPRLVSVLVHSAEEAAFDAKQGIRFYKESLQHLIQNKLPTPRSFNVNSQLYFESLAHNTFFNKKVCINQAGYWKNSLEISQDFGHIGSTSLQEVLQNSEFKKLWSIKKDDIDVCKDCEFRHMCVDARTPMQKDETSWYFNTSCHYNPYIAKWRHEEGYQGVSRATT